MADPLKEYLRLKQEAARRAEEAARAEGALERTLEELREEGCADLQAAAALEKKLEKEAAALERELTAGLAAWEAEHGDRLEGGTS